MFAKHPGIARRWVREAKAKGQAVTQRRRGRKRKKG